MTNYKRIALAVLIMLLLVVTPAAAQSIRQNFEWIVAKRITVNTSGITVTRGDVVVTESVTAADVTASDLVTAADVTASDDIVASDDITVTDDLTVAGDMVLTAPVRAVLPLTSTLAPVTANVPISSSAAAGLIVTCGAGKLYRVVNIGAQNILITDTATMKLTANMTLGALDNITLLGDGTNCVELARSNN